MIEITDKIISQIGDKIVEYSPGLFMAVIIFTVFYGIAWITRKIAVKLSRKMDTDKSTVIRLVGSIFKAVIIILGLITALGTLGIDITALVAGLGLTGFALGFALKDALSNLLAGVLVLFYQPFRCGDEIEVAGCKGVVTEINLRYTVLKGETAEFLIPNSVCFTKWIAVHKKTVKSEQYQ